MSRPTSDEQAARNRAICADRARGYTWPTVASRHGISTRRAQQIVRGARRRNFRGEQAHLDVLHEAIEELDQAIEELAEFAARSKNAAIQLGATNAKLKAQARRVALKQAARDVEIAQVEAENRFDEWQDERRRAAERKAHYLELFERLGTYVPPSEDGEAH